MNQNIFSNRSQWIALLLIGLLGLAALVFVQRSLINGTESFGTLSSPTVSTLEKPLDGIDPADRKFLTDNFNIEYKAAPQSDLLAGIDPADHKFFSNNFNMEYQAAPQSDLLNNIDPADRKFFNGPD